MRRVLMACAAAVLALADASRSAHAITYGYPDSGHPEAGAMYFSAGLDAPRRFACSGVLIDATAFLTAAHCFTEALRNGSSPTVWVTFDQHPDASSTYYHGSYTLDPQYTKVQSSSNLYADDIYDFAVVRLDTAPGITPASLPPLDALDSLPRSQSYEVVGYGTSATYGGGQPPTYPSTSQREVAYESFNAISQSWLHLSQNPTLGNGGACGGDSGGPNYIGDSHVVAGTTITGDYICRSTNVAIRLDTPAARAFLATQVSYPLP